jgi:hypothetical protein
MVLIQDKKILMAIGAPAVIDGFTTIITVARITHFAGCEKSMYIKYALASTQITVGSVGFDIDAISAGSVITAPPSTNLGFSLACTGIEIASITINTRISLFILIVSVDCPLIQCSKC